MKRIRRWLSSFLYWAQDKLLDLGLYLDPDIDERLKEWGKHLHGVEVDDTGDNENEN